MEELTGTFKSFDKEELFYRSWQNKETWNKKVVLLLHRGHEHSQRLSETANNEIFKNYKIYSYDNRGHGYTKASASYEFMNLVRDLDEFVKFVCQEEKIEQEDIFVIANSVAGVVTATWVHDFAPKISGIALLAPAFKIKLYVPFAKESLKLITKFFPKLNIKSYVKSKLLTHDEKEQKKYDEDKLITPDIPATQLTTLLDTAKRVVDDAALISTPTLVLSATKDYVVDSKVQGDFYSKLSSKLKKFVPLKDFYHGILYETNKHLIIDEIESFMTQCFKNKADSYLEEKIKITQNETDKIAYGTLPLTTSISFFIQKQMLNRLGFLSDGMKIGLKYGFDSGVTLDYVYKNEASGKTFIGKAIDKNYLESIGWVGIRQRKVHIIQTLKETIKEYQEKNIQVKILDIAGGPARYLIDICREFEDIEVFVQDYQIQNINEGQELAKKYKLNNIQYKQADAFDEKTYEELEFTPTIVVISGVFELFSSNSLIKNAIKGVSCVLQNNGTLIYTGQPWHPQLEQIAHVLGNHQDSQWIMRRRSQYELDNLFETYKFKKQDMKIDNYGIFTVSKAIINKEE